MIKPDGMGRRSEKALALAERLSKVLDLMAARTRSGLSGRSRDPADVGWATIGGRVGQSSEGGAERKIVAGGGGDSHEDFGAESERRVGISNLRLGQTLA